MQGSLLLFYAPSWSLERHKMISSRSREFGWERCWGCKGPLEIIWSDLQLLQQGHPEQAGQDHVKVAFECLNFWCFACCYDAIRSLCCPDFHRSVFLLFSLPSCSLSLIFHLVFLWSVSPKRGTMLLVLMLISLYKDRAGSPCSARLYGEQCEITRLSSL